MKVDPSRIKAICEALIFVSEEPLPFRKINAVLEGIPAPELRKVLTELIEQWKEAEGGIHLVEVAEGYQFRTRPENTEWIKMLVQFKPARLSKAALETLAIVAYNQPTTKPDIEEIRGVDCSSSLSQLLEKGLIRILGRKEAPGKPFIYGTTRKFLEVMGLKDLSYLPTLREIEESEIIKLEGLEDLEEDGEEINELERAGADQEAEQEEQEPPGADPATGADKEDQAVEKPEETDPEEQ